MKTIYISGPMRGLPNNNVMAFADAADKLCQKGWWPVNPIDFDKVFGNSGDKTLLAACMDAELAVIPHLDAIFLLNGWEKSEGAKAELEVALHHGLKVMLQGECQ